MKGMFITTYFNTSITKIIYTTIIRIYVKCTHRAQCTKIFALCREFLVNQAFTSPISGEFMNGCNYEQYSSQTLGTG